MDYHILIIFSISILNTTGYQMTIYFSASPNFCFSTTWEKQNKQNTTFLSNAVSLFDSYNTHLAHFVQISSTLDNSLFKCSVVQLLAVYVQNIGHLWNIRQEMNSAFVDNSIDNVLLETSTSRFLSSLIFLNSVL